MTEIFIVAGWILLGICLINYGVDFVFFLKDRYCRYHIGRWERQDWYTAVEKTASKWLKKTPTVKITDNNRYILLDMLNGKYRSATIQSWQKAALVMALSEGDDQEKKYQVWKAIDGYFDSTGMWREKPTRVDCGMISLAVLKEAEDVQGIKPAMDYSVEIIISNVNDKGLVSYTYGKSNNDMYVDTIGLTVPFLVGYAKYYKAPEYEELGFRQLRSFHDHGLFKGTNIPNHAYDLLTGLPLGVYGWGRGTGWYVLGLIESLDLFVNTQYREIMKEWILEAAEEYKNYQREDGGFGSIVQSKNTYDSSATSVMAFFYATTAELFQSEEYYHIADMCLDKLMSCTRMTGAIDWCQGDTKAIGVFSQIYDIMPFAQGMTLRALNVMRRSKIK